MILDIVGNLTQEMNEFASYFERRLEQQFSEVGWLFQSDSLDLLDCSQEGGELDFL